MENFKIDLFKEEYNIDFPYFTHLTKEECDFFIREIINKYNIKNSEKLVEELNIVQSVIHDFNADENFKLVDLFENYNIKYNSKIFINWYKFDNIDEMELVDLDKYFYDIWFPSSDDIDLFDESLNWILSIRHDGCITLITH